MTTIEEVEAKRREIEMLRLSVDELRYMRELSKNILIDENGSALDKDRAIKEFHAKIVELHTEIQELQDAKDILIKEKDARIKELEGYVAGEIDKLQKIQDVLASSIEGVTSIIGEWLDSDKRPIGNLVALSNIADLLNTLDKKVESMSDSSEVPDRVTEILSEHTTGQDDILDVIKGKVKELEKSLNEDLPEGMSVSVLPQRVSPKQMSEILKVAEED